MLINENEQKAKEEISTSEVTKKRLVKQPLLFKAMDVRSRQAEWPQAGAQPEW